MATTIEKVYKLEVQGTDSINDLKSAIEQLNDKLKTLNETSNEYKETLEQLTELQGKLADVMNGISDSTSKTNESLDGIKETVESVADSITNLTDAASGDVLDAFANGLAQGMAEAAQEATKAKENITELGEINSVKDLKQHISDLKDKLVTLEKGSKEWNETVKERIESEIKLKDVMNAGKNEMQAAEGSYNALSQRMSALKQVWKETTDEATRNEIGKQINEINTQLKALDASIGNSQRNVGNYKSALDGLDGSFVNWKQELKECKEAMQQLDPSTQAYADAMARAAELTHQMADQQEMIKYSSTDLGDQLNNVRGIASNLAAGYSAVNAAMGLFGEENEDVQQAMLKVQQAMALVQGMQGIDGFIKRTKGLSQSLGLVTKATKANTVATQANAVASKADATAKGAEAVATKAAVPAQLSLNAAMEANPIGFIIGLIAALVTGIMLLKDKIMEMIGANEEMSAAFDKVKAVLAGFGNVIKKSIVNPIKMAIIPIKTLGKLLADLFTGNWSKMADDIKDGFTEMKDTAIDSINVVGAFKEGYDKKTAEQDEAARKKRAEARSKELDNIIKDNEAKYGNDWKYTKDAQKIYQQMFKERMAMYDKDSDEYKEAVREKMAYDREFSENQIELAKSALQEELAYKKALYGDEYEFSDEWHQKVLAGLEEAQKSYDKALKDYNDAERKAIEEFAAELGVDPDDPNIIIGVSMKLLNPDIYETLNQQKKVLDETKKEVQIYEKRLDNFRESETKKQATAYKNALNDIRNTFEKYVSDITRESWNFDDIIAKWENSINIYRTYLKNTRKLTDEQIEEILGEIRNKLVKSTDDALVKAASSEMEKAISNIEKSLRTAISDINSEFNSKKLLEGIKFPEEEIQHSRDVFIASSEAINEELSAVTENIDRIFAELTKEGSDYFGMTEEEIANELPEFQRLIEKEISLRTRQKDIYLNYFSEIADIIKRNYQMEEKAENNWYNNRLKQMELRYQKEQALAERNEALFDGSNRIEALRREQDFENKTFNTRLEMYQRLRERYNEMSEDMRLTAEERANAEAEAAKVTGQIIEAEMEHTNQLLKIQKEKIKEWRNAIKDAASNIGSILNSIGDYWSSMIELERTAIDTELESGEISKDVAEKRKKQNEEEFERYKAFQITVTTINTIAGAIGAFLQASSSYPPPWGQILGGISAAAVAAAGAVEIAKLQSTSYGSSSVGSSAGGSTNFTLPDVMEYEPSYLENQTGLDNIDNLNNDGSGNGGGGEKAVRAYVVESDVSASQELARKRTSEVTF